MPSSFRLGAGRKTTSRHTTVSVKKPLKMPHTELINRRQTGYTEKDLNCGMWNVQTQFQTTAITSLLSPVKTSYNQHNSTIGNKVGGEGYNGYEITYTLIQ
jgi:hypothetical protein